MHLLKISDLSFDKYLIIYWNEKIKTIDIIYKKIHSYVGHHDLELTEFYPLFACTHKVEWLTLIGHSQVAKT